MHKKLKWKHHKIPNTGLSGDLLGICKICLFSQIIWCKTAVTLCLYCCHFKLSAMLFLAEMCAFATKIWLETLHAYILLNTGVS